MLKTGKILKNPRETVLVALVGLSPAVLTETIYALVNQKKTIPGRVVVITTEQGCSVLRKELFERGGWDALVQLIKKKFGASFKPISFGDTSDSIRVLPSLDGASSLNDVRTLEDHTSVADFMMRQVRSFTEDPDVQLIVSIAGGRKTMGALLFSVMTLIGRAGDIVCHVLVNEPWDRFPAFLYPGSKGDFLHPVTGKQLDSCHAVIELAEIPFVPLRNLFKRELLQNAPAYSRLVASIVNEAQQHMLDLQLYLEPGCKLLRVGDQELSLSAKEFAFLLYFADLHKSGIKQIESFADLTEDRMQAFVRRYSPDTDFNHWSHQVIEDGWDPKEEPRKCASAIREKLKHAGFQAFEIDAIVPGRKRFSIHIPPDNIRIETG